MLALRVEVGDGSVKVEMAAVHCASSMAIGFASGPSATECRSSQVLSSDSQLPENELPPGYPRCPGALFCPARAASLAMQAQLLQLSKEPAQNGTKGLLCYNC